MSRSRTKRVRVPQDVVTTFLNLQADEHSLERISEITGYPVTVIKSALNKGATVQKPNNEKIKE